ncbi:MAG: hypothetical protein ACC700_16415, partial [Anaerolineales bacterium]
LTFRADADYLPNLIIAGGEPGEGSQPALMEERAMREGLPTAYLCQGFVCQLPTTNADELSRQLASALSS